MKRVKRFGRDSSKAGITNGNYRGGVSKIRYADEILELELLVQVRLRKKLVSSIILDEVSGCWNWTGDIFTTSGYSRFFCGPNGLLGHKVSFVLFCRMKTAGFCVCHSCDNKLCVNPEHLWLGTNQDNSDDMVAKGRVQDQTGSKNKSSVLTESIVAEIKSRLRAGQKQNKLALEFNVCKQTICFIANNVTWRHVE